MKTQGNHRMKTQTATRLLCLALVLVVISCTGASMLQTNFGKVQVYDIKLPVDGGKWISANLYKPKSATAENPAPLVIASHGGANNKEMQDMPAIELSRRGMVVIVPDRYFHGESSAAETELLTTMLTENTTAVPMVEYGATLDYVDATKIGVTGHSMGGGTTWSTLFYYGSLYNQALTAAATNDSDGGVEITAAERSDAEALNKVAAGFPTSMIDLCVDPILSQIHANVGVNFGMYDENGYSRPSQTSIITPTTAEAVSLIKSIDPTATQMELDKYYGNAADKTLRVFHNPAETHPWQHFSSASAGYMTDFFENSFQTFSGFAANNQIWLWKELFNLIGLVGAFLFIIPCGVLLLRVPCFASLTGELPKAQPALDTPKQKLMFWGGWCLSWVVSFCTYIPISDYMSKTMFSGTYDQYGGLFPCLTVNFLVPWALVNALFGVIWFWVSYRWLGGKASGAMAANWGVRITLTNLLKTIGLALCIFAGFYALVFGANYFFHTDFRIWFVAAKTFTANKLWLAIPYLLVFIPFYLVNALLTNSANRIDGQKEWVNLLICGLGNVMGLLLLMLVQYGALFATGTVVWGGNWLAILILLPLILELFVAAYINRYLFRETGCIWLGATVNCMIIVMMGVTNTTILTQLVR